MSHLINGKEIFLTKSFTDVSLKMIPLVLAIIDLPFTSNPHKFESDGQRGINITSNSPLVLFRKEIKEKECNIKNDILLNQFYMDTKSNIITDMRINEPYICKINLTNISPVKKEVTLLYQIPNGSLPLKITKYINSK